MFIMHNKLINILGQLNNYTIIQQKLIDIYYQKGYIKFRTRTRK